MRRIIPIVLLVVGLISIVVISMLLLSQYNLVHNAYDVANKDWTAKTIAWFMWASCVLFVVVGITGIKQK